MTPAPLLSPWVLRRGAGSFDRFLGAGVRSAPMGATVVVTTVGTEEQANTIARELVARRQAACVNIIRGVRSVYRWQGKICNDGELLLVAKTMAGELDAITATIQELHDYDVPEILCFDVAGGERTFLDWIAASVDKSIPLPDEDDDDGPPFPDTD